MYVLQKSHVDPVEIRRLVEEISQLIKNADHLLSARDVQQKLDAANSSEAIAKALRVAIERGALEITDNMKLRASDQGDLPGAAMAQ